MRDIVGSRKHLLNLRRTAVPLSFYIISIILACFSLQIVLNSFYITASDFISSECVQCLRIERFFSKVC